MYEIDVTAPPTNAKAANLTLKARVYSLSVSYPPPEAAGQSEIEIQNNYEAVKVMPQFELLSEVKHETLEIKGALVNLAIPLTKEDLAKFSSVRVHVDTNKKYYDLMTDYPYRVFDSEQKVLAAGGLELSSDIDVDTEKLKPEPLSLELQGAFAKEAPRNGASSSPTSVF